MDDGFTNSTVNIKSVQSGGSMDIQLPIHNKLIQKNQSKKTQSYKVESVSRRTIMDIHNFSLENKRESEYVSQSRRSNQVAVSDQFSFCSFRCFILHKSINNKQFDSTVWRNMKHRNDSLSKSPGKTTKRRKQPGNTVITSPVLVMWPGSSQATVPGT